MSLATVEILPRDFDAIEIGQLYLKGATSMINSVRYLLDAGRRLIEKKQALGHGNWLPWLATNVDALGFEEWTAQRLMRAATKYVASHGFNEDQARQISREILGPQCSGHARQR